MKKEELGKRERERKKERKKVELHEFPPKTVPVAVDFVLFLRMHPNECEHQHKMQSYLIIVI
jgi:hypothetical protein